MAAFFTENIRVNQLHLKNCCKNYILLSNIEALVVTDSSMEGTYPIMHFQCSTWSMMQMRNTRGIATGVRGPE